MSDRKKLDLFAHRFKQIRVQQFLDKAGKEGRSIQEVDKGLRQFGLKLKMSPPTSKYAPHVGDKQYVKYLRKQGLDEEQISLLLKARKENEDGTGEEQVNME